MTGKFHISCFLIFTLGFTGGLLSQTDNLVANPSFEVYKSLPIETGDGNTCISAWKFPNFPGGGDYYHSDALSNKTKTKKNHFGHQAPHSGKAYAGICISKECREYLQTQLIRPLTKGQVYEIKLYISCADKFYLSTVNEFSIVFSKKPFNIVGNDFLLSPPKLKFVQLSKYSNTKEWQELVMEYTANGTEAYLTFGSFPYLENEKEYGEIFGFSQYAHYYVDDISIIALEKEGTIKTPVEVPKEAVLTKAFVAGETYVLENIQFETGKSILLPASFLELDQLKRYLLQHPKTKLHIVGHTDNVGSKTSNLKLSGERANAVKQYLIRNKTINKEFISIEGKGDTAPLNKNETEADREKNRRVAFSFY